MSAVPKVPPYVWVTWITKLLAGECSCEWSAWFKSNFKNYERAPDDFDSVTWQMDHADLLRRTRDKFDSEGYKVSVESQNFFTLCGQVGTLAGKPDIIAIKDDYGFIIDAKTGQPKMSDQIQVMTYIWAIPKALPQFKNIRFDGKIVYKSYESIVLGRSVDDVFANRVRTMMRKVCNSTPARKCPSFSECRYCSIARNHCSERIDNEEEQGFSAETIDF